MLKSVVSGLLDLLARRLLKYQPQIWAIGADGDQCQGLALWGCIGAIEENRDTHTRVRRRLNVKLRHCILAQ